MNTHVYPTVSRHSILDGTLRRRGLIILALAVMAWTPVAFAIWLATLAAPYVAFVLKALV